MKREATPRANSSSPDVLGAALRVDRFPSQAGAVRRQFGVAVAARLPDRAERFADAIDQVSCVDPPSVPVRYASTPFEDAAKAAAPRG